MSIVDRLLKAYFNYAYNPVYDFTTGHLNHYYRLQTGCIGKLTFGENDKVLCGGLGTGNELICILEKSPDANITGFDFSQSALKKASRKLSSLGHQADLRLMDARSLTFAPDSFDIVVLIHVTDFVKEHEVVVRGLLRVLKEGGQFVMTFPMAEEGASLGINLVQGGLSHASVENRGKIRNFFESAARVMVGMVYLPLLMRPKVRHYSRSELETFLANYTAGNLQIEEFRDYQDFIVYGRKITQG